MRRHKPATPTGEKTSHDPKFWLKQHVKPPKMPQTLTYQSENDNRILCGYLEKNFERWSQPKHKLHWHKRWFTLDSRKRMLSYYKAGVQPEDLHRTQPRGWIDLTKPGTALLKDANLLLSSPTDKPLPPNLFQLKFPSDGESGQNQEVLNLSAPSDDAYQQWTKAIEEAIAPAAKTFLEVPSAEFPAPHHSPQTPTLPPSRRKRSVTFVPPTPEPKTVDVKWPLIGFNSILAIAMLGGDFGFLLTLLGGNAGLWYLSQESASSNASGMHGADARPSTPTTPTAPSFPNKGLQETVASLGVPVAFMQSKNLPMSLAGFNIILLVAIFGGFLGFLLVALGGNGAIWKFLSAPKPKVSYGVSARQRSVNAVSVSDDERDDDAEEDEDEESDFSGGPARRAPSPMPPQPGQRHMPKKVRHIGGQSLPTKKGPNDVNCWDIPDPTSFNVRIGPNYAKNKQKAPSQGSILTPVGADVFTCPKKVGHVMQYIQFPSVGFEVAHWFVVNAQLCNYAPANPMFGSGELDGPGMSLIVYSPIPTALWEQIQAARAGPLELLRRFLHADQSPNPEAIYDRCKVIARLVNFDDPALQLSGASSKLVKTYNSKPVLTRPQHRIIHADFYTELDIDLHEFSYLARRGLAGFMPKIKDLVISICLVIEGHSDSELPEKVLSCFTINKVDFERAPPW